MKSFQALYTKCQNYASDTSNNQFFKDAINEGEKIVENDLDGFEVEDVRTGSTIAGFNQIPTPENYLRAKFLYVTSGSIRYDAKFIYSEEAWQRMAAFTTSNQSNYLQFAFPRLDWIELYPTPSSILTYTFQYVSQQRDMQYDDYSTGTITSITNTVPTGALPYATVVGSSTVWTKYMAGQYFQMAGDKQWYKITSVTDSTHLVLSKAYAGIAIAGFANTNYTIGEMPRIPEAAHILLYYYAMKEYYGGPKKDAAKYTLFSGLFDKWMAWTKGTFSNRIEMGVIPNQRSLRRGTGRNPNLFPQNLS